MELTAEEAYESYMNGNITEAKNWLKECSKQELVEFIEIWESHEYTMNLSKIRAMLGD